MQIQSSELRKKCEPANMGTGQIHMETKSPAFRYKLRTLLILLAVGPVVLAGLWVAFVTPSPQTRGFHTGLQPLIRPAINFAGLSVLGLMVPAVLLARRLLRPARN